MKDSKDVTVLVVDDEAALRQAIAFDFKRKGFKVLEAGNGSEAFECVQKNKIDIIISDVRMPNGDGVELLTKVKLLSPALPVVMFITGFADLSLEDAYDKGADAVFSKPFDRKLLMAAVMRAIAPKEKTWSRATERIEVQSDLIVDLNFPDLNFAVQGKVMNIGRGGVFVALEGRLPKVGSQASLTIRFAKDNIKEIVGEGVVRWIRGEASPSLRPGCGFEFSFLSDESRSAVIALIESLMPKAFIPKT